MDLQAYLKARRALVEEALDRLLPPATEHPEKLHEAIRYSVLAPGKRIRPILALAAAESIGGRAEDVLPAACAMECIHVFSLIHDDLPCMDNDAYRRGLPTNHMVFGEAMAMLAGDALLALAFELIATPTDPQHPQSWESAGMAERIVPVLKMVSRATGTAGMVGGQVSDIESEGKDISAEMLQHIHAHKTGALLTASVMAGALLAGADACQQNALQSYGRSIGLAFQIADDILDVVGDQQRIGKPVGSDEKSDKATYPKLFGLDESRKRAKAESEQAVKALSRFGETAEPLRSIARYIVDRDL